MKSVQFFLVLLFCSVIGTLGLPILQDEEGVDFPILKPADDAEAKETVTVAPAEAVAQPPTPTQDDHTEYPILKPSPDDYQVERPVPTDNAETSESGSGQGGEDKPVDRPQPEEENVFPGFPSFFPKDGSVVELSNQGLKRLRRSADSSNDESDDTILIESIDGGGFDYEDDEDAVVVNAATCEDLKKDCEGTFNIMHRDFCFIKMFKYFIF
jgi:hypothetical protein